MLGNPLEANQSRTSEIKSKFWNQIKKPLGSVAHLFSSQKHWVYWGQDFAAKSFYTTFSSQGSNMSRELVKLIQKSQFIKNKYKNSFIKIKSLTKKPHFSELYF